MNLQKLYLGKTERKSLRTGRAGLYMVHFLTSNTCLKDSDSATVGLRCVYLMMKLSLKCMVVHKRYLSFSVAVAITASVTSGDSFPGPEVQQAGFKAWTPSEDQMRVIWSSCPSGLHIIPFKARLNCVLLLKSDTELFTAGQENFPMYVSVPWFGKQLLAQCLVCGWTDSWISGIAALRYKNNN